MRIITVLHSHGCGGAERHALLLMKLLRQAGHTPLFAGPQDSWLGEQVAQLGIEAIHLPLHGFYDVPSIVRLTRLCRRWRADVVHGHLTRGAYYAGLGGRLSGTPVVATAHSTNAGKHFGRANRIIAVSEAVKRFMLERGYGADRVRLVYHAVEDRFPENAEQRNTMREKLGLANEDIALCLVARMVRDKGHDLLLNALAGLENSPLQTFFLGDFDTDWGRRMKQLSHERGLDECVHFLGHVDDVYPVLAAMDVCVAPSRREALSLTLLEAALVQCALLGAETGGIPEVIRDGLNGWLFPAEDTAALQQRLQGLADGELDWCGAGIRAREDALQRFSLHSMLDATLAVYEEAEKSA